MLNFFRNFHNVVYVARIQHVVYLACRRDEELFAFFDSAVAGVG